MKTSTSREPGWEVRVGSERFAAESPPADFHELGTGNLNPPGVGLFELLREDLRTHDDDLLAQGFWALALHRLGNWRMDLRPRLLRAPFSVAYKALYVVVQCATGISLSYTVQVGRRVRIWHHGGMILGARAIGDDVHIRQNTTFGVARRGAPVWCKPIIGDRVDVGCGAVILGPITVGDDATIGANSVVLADVPPGGVAVGAPAQVVKIRPTNANARPDYQDLPVKSA